MLLISSEQCNGPCGKQVSPNQLFQRGQARICANCYAWHLEGLALLNRGVLPSGCQNCGTTFSQLNERGLATSMAIHPKDGVYAVLCKPCSDHYERVTPQFYAGTQYGHEKGLVN